LRAEEARRAHAGHIRYVRDGRPHVMLKLAVSSDDKAGLAGRKPAPITGAEARARVHMLRAMHDAVVTGIGTVRADDPLLTCRLPGMSDRSPVRVVLDGKLLLPLTSQLATTAGTTPLWVVCAENASPEAEQALGSIGAEVLRAPSRDSKLDLAVALKLLAGRGLTRVMVEAGPILAAAFIKADLVDAVELFRSPDPIGADGIDALENLLLDAITRSPRLTWRGSEAIGRDRVETFERA
jgi:diaminohydroxyphosphoribosylaminopyrimidine deaminase / 5-amino-6-(5-phosphoribosylamino)uracil reductase